jgi:2-succinyl-5-enolpyruvyl-6-hydroxy-3-cyclohexene-1-carboxylate synthase
MVKSKTQPLKFEILARVAAICAQKNIRHFVISPGSRSAPLTISFIRQPQLQCRVVMDERAAGFIALGLAQQTQTPVGLVCTSGTAAMNYGPAVIEAFYQQIPLLVFTADRPPEWIDQQDGQTIHQPHLYGSHCRASFEFPVDVSHPDAQWHAERIISEAINASLWPRPGPVHLNVPLREPLYPSPNTQITPSANPKVIQLADSEPTLAPSTWEGLRAGWQKAGKKLIVAGMQAPDPSLAAALVNLQQESSVAVIADVMANLHQTGSQLHHADMILGTKSTTTLASLKPDLLVSFGGPVVSKYLKLFLRQYQPPAHWHIDPSGQTIDTFQSLTRIIPVRAPYFFNNLTRLNEAKPAPPAAETYFDHWLKLETKAQAVLTALLADTPFGEFQAVYQVLQALPESSRLQLGNSMPVRYANFIGLGPEIIGAKDIRVNANRGTSGIDGTLSTTVGAALASDNITTLITGDLAFFYDRNALWHNHVPPNLRVVILNNRGGGIFKLIDGPSHLPEAELEEFFFTPQPLTAKNTAADHQCAYFYSRTARELKQQLPEFFALRSRAAILEIETDSAVNTTVFQQFKSRLAGLGS